MRDTNARTLRIITLVLGMVMIACPLLAQDAIWPMYHYDIYHSGQNPNSTDIKGTDDPAVDPSAHGPGTLNLVWVFPRLDAGGGISDESMTVVDDADATNFSATGLWIPGPGLNGYNGAYYYCNAVRNATDPVPTATWIFPSKLPKGKYLIYVWVTPDEHGNVAARYTVTDDNGSRDVTFDQSKGGSWRAISLLYYSFTGATPNQGVKLSARVGDDTAGDLIMADAVKFILATGQEIYSSPASADIDVTLPDPDDPSLPDVWPKAPATCVFVGTVETEPSLKSISGLTQPRDKGAIYCIYGITPTLVSPYLKDGKAPNPLMSDKDRDRFVKISKYLGKPKWRYPKADPSMRKNPIEGPIDGGIYSSPTLAQVGQAGGTKKLVCFVAGMDRQLYALDAESGDLLWKGPGITVPE